MAGETDVSAVNGLAKRVYDKAIVDARPGVSIAQRKIGWDKGTRNIGESYQVGVALQPPNGFTYPGSAGGVTTLKAPRNSIIKQASIIPFEMELREQMVYTALSRAAKEGEGAFKQLAGEVFLAMKKAMVNRLEASALLGQQGWGQVSSVTDNGSGIQVTLGGVTYNTADIVMTTNSWAPGLWWALGVGATMDSYSSLTSGSKHNSGGAIILAGIFVNGSAVTSAPFTIRVAYSGSFGTQVQANDILVPEGTYDGTTFYEMPGLITQLSNTSGTSLGLSATTYPNWAGNTYAVGGNINSEIVEDGISKLRDRGAEGKLEYWCGNKQFSVLMNELKQLRIIDSSYKPTQGQTGFKEIEYFSPDIGEVALVNHPMMPYQYGIALNPNDAGRVGSSDITFGVPGMESEQLFVLVQNTNAAEVQAFTDQAIIHKRPGFGMVFTGITYS